MLGKRTLCSIMQDVQQITFIRLGVRCSKFFWLLDARQMILDFVTSAGASLSHFYHTPMRERPVEAAVGSRHS